jgi:uncharacterized protein (DUF302 family)
MLEIAATESAFPYFETIDRLAQGIVESGATLFAKIDQRTAADAVGLTLRPTTLLVFGNPKAGTPLMHDYPLAALDLPLKLLIWEEAETVRVAHVPLSALAARYEIPDGSSLLAPLQRAIDALLTLISR